MSLDLTYDEDLARVRISATGLPDVAEVRIERSTNEIYWETVRGALRLPVAAGTASVDDYEFAASAENHYRVMAIGDDGLYLPGQAGSYVSALDPTPIVAASDADPSESDPAIAPSVEAPTGGLLVCSWTSYSHPIPYVLPGTMTEVVQQTGTWSVNAVATETVPAGATGTRSAGTGSADAWSTASVLIPGTVTVEDAQWSHFNANNPDGDGPEITTAAAQPGWWAIALCVADFDDQDRLPGRPPGEGWRMLTASPVGSASRTVVWARRITDAGPVTAGFQTVGVDSYLTVLLLSGAEADGGFGLTDNLDVRVEADLAWRTPETKSLVGQWLLGGDQRSWRFAVTDGGRLRLYWSTTGADVASGASSVLVPITEGPLAVRATRNATTGELRFYTAEGIDGPWTQLGPAVTGSAGPMYPALSGVDIGAHNAGELATWAGSVTAVEVRSGINGPIVADPTFTGHPTGTTSFTDSQGVEWTVHGDAQILGSPIAEGSITPDLGKTVWLKSIRFPALNRPIHRVLAGAGQEIGRASRGTVHEIQGRSVPIASTDRRSSKTFTLTIQVADEQAAAELDLVLAASDTFFIQVPPELRPHMQGGYVYIGDTSQHRVADTIKWRFTLPCRVIAPPGPGVVGTTITWGTVLRIYGSWQALLESSPAWADLLDTVGGPDDLVVL